MTDHLTTFRPALRAEWIKLRTIRSTRWSTVAIVVAIVGVTAFFAAVGSTDANAVGEGDDDVVANSLLGILFGQLAVVVLGAVVFTSEYATRVIGVTYAAVPRRGVVLAAKATVASGIAFVAGAVGCLTSFLVAQPLIHDGGFFPPAYPRLSLTDASVQRALVGSVLFLTALALLAVGLAAVLRHATATTSILFGLLLLPSLLYPLLPESIADQLRRLGPTAGLAVVATVDRPDNIPIGPWFGLAVTWAWAAASLLIAYLAVTRRDP